MRSKLINTGELKTFALILNNLRASQFTGIGAFRKVTLGFFDFSKRDYLKIEVNEQVELLSLIGDITLYKNKHLVYPHVVVGKRDGTACGGHLLKAIVHPTLELIIKNRRVISRGK